MSPDSPVRLDISAQGVATLTLDRKDGPNAVNPAFVDAMQSALAQLAQRDDLRLVVMRGTGPSFCVGGDVVAMNAHRDDLLALLKPMVTGYHAVVLALKKLKAPVLGSVHGPIAGGGFSIAMACDLVIAARSTRFVVAYPQLATSCDGGLSFFLRQRLGSARAMQALTVDGIYPAQRALELGLVNRLADDDKLIQETDQWAAEFAALPLHTLREVKGLLAAQDTDALALQLDRELASVLHCATTADFADRVAAFCKPRER